MQDGERRLAAIMFTDMVGYTALAQDNEPLAMELLDEQRRTLRPFFAKNNGREVKTIGDAFLVEFASSIMAVKCAFEIQSHIQATNSNRPEEKRLLLRIGIHLGDVIHSEADITGDAVNVAFRIQAIAPIGGVCVTEQVYDSVVNKVEYAFETMGTPELKNVSRSIEVYRISGLGLTVGRPPFQKSSLPKDRIAVLPFINMSPDPKDEYFADGMTEEVISTLAKVRDFEVISRTSIMQYKSVTKSIAEVSRNLNAGTILEGSVRKAGSRLRITVQMIDAARDRHLWAENYDRDFQDVFAVQGEIAARVADALRVRLLPAEKAGLVKKPTSSTEAYSLYLKGRHYWNRMGPDDVKKALEYFELAVREDPNFALGYTGEADCHLTLRNKWNIDPRANLEKALAMVARALELDPDLAEAHATRGSILINEGRPRQAEEEFERAIELKPSYAEAHMLYIPLLASQLKWEEALRHIEKAVELDPLSPIVNYNHGSFYAWRGEYTKAVEPLKKAVELGLNAGHWALGYVYGRMKMFDNMKREYAIAVDLFKDSVPLARMDADAYTAYHEGDVQTLRRILPDLETGFNDTGLSAYEIAGFYFYLGEREKGFEWLKHSYSRDEGPLHITYEKDYDRVRDNPRYLDLLKRLGLS